MKNSYSFTLFAVAMMFFATSTAFAATDDYVNYYPFDEGTGRTVADVKSGQNAVFTGTSSGFGWTSGMIGTALAMDGVDGESVELPDGFLKGSQGSLAVWFKLNDLTDRNIIFSGRSTADNYIYGALMVNFEGRPQFLFRTSSAGVDKKVQGGKILNKNEWYQLVLIANSQGYRMFINGEEAVMTGDNIGRWFADLSNHVFLYRVGALFSNPLIGVFNGHIDDLRIYDRALNDLEVKELYNDGDPGKPGFPVSAQPPQPVVASVDVETADMISWDETASVVNDVVPVTEVTLPSMSAPTEDAPQELVAVSTAEERKALIDSLIKQILLLILELQKHLEALKGQTI